MAGIRRTLTLLALLGLMQASHGLTLEEYGVSLADNGLVDHVSGLQWLDSGLTQGGLDELQFWLDAGWRIASEQELYFLLTRENAEFGGTAELPLNIDDFSLMMERLSVDASPDGLSFGGPWVCRAFGNPQSACSSVGSLGGQFFLELGSVQGQLILSMYVYLSEVPIYGSLDCYEDPMYCNYMGRSLMVRAFPLPGAFVLMLSALTVLTAGGRRWKRLNDST